MGDDLNTRESLLVRLRDPGDDPAWESFYRQYAGAIVSFCCKKGLDHAGACDVLQETMFLLIDKMSGFIYDPARGKFRNWLLTIVARKIGEAWRRAGCDATVPLEGLDPTLGEALATGPKETAADHLELSWDIALIEQALRELEADQRSDPRTFAIFRAYVLEEQDAAEVALAFGVAENVVYQARNRLLKRLRKKFDELQNPLACEAV